MILNSSIAFGCDLVHHNHHKDLRPLFDARESRVVSSTGRRKPLLWQLARSPQSGRRLQLCLSLNYLEHMSRPILELCTKNTNSWLKILIQCTVFSIEWIYMNMVMHTWRGFLCRWWLTTDNTPSRAPFAGACQLASPRVSHDVTSVRETRWCGWRHGIGIDIKDLAGIHQADAARAGGVIVLLLESVLAILIRDDVITRTATCATRLCVVVVMTSSFRHEKDIWTINERHSDASILIHDVAGGGGGVTVNEVRVILPFPCVVVASFYRHVASGQ